MEAMTYNGQVTDVAVVAAVDTHTHTMHRAKEHKQWPLTQELGRADQVCGLQVYYHYHLGMGYGVWGMGYGDFMYGSKKGIRKTHS